ncbi:SET domain-containingprotein [Purpureocillium lilacinum]|uniref:SET domain-containingprotein n=1 Tax=Purpureocillium lilacinum TaxID=33203 RepID=A0A179HBG3_PURLI|nr:SET domain-containingprotein [Purpureocillium lilacinum]
MLSLRTLVRLCCVGSAIGGQLHFISEEICLRSPPSLSQCGRDRPEKFHGLMPSALDVGDATGPSLFRWDFKPRCITPDEADEPFCLYSSHSFASGRGISILTTPDRIESIMQLPAFAQSNYSHGPGTPASPPFEERELPGRGRGLIANKTVFRGDRIFAYTPVLLLDDEAYEALDEDEWVKLEAAAVEQLPAASRAEFWQLFGQPTVNPVTDRINTNAFEIDTAKGTFYGVFPEIARLNHDCRPNAAYFFDEESFTHYVHATTTVAPGTELTITYIDPHMPRSQRRRRLSSSWGFQCTCSLCTAHASISQESDSRLKQITDLTERLENSRSSSSEMAKTLISLYEQERMHAARAFGLDLSQLVRFLVFTVLTAPPNFIWQQLLERRLPAYPVDARRQKKQQQRDVELKGLEEAARDSHNADHGSGMVTPRFSLRNTLAKWCIDCMTAGAVMNTVAFLAIMGLLKSQPGSQIWHNIKTETIPIIVAGYKIWPIASIISFSFVPVHRRIVFLSFVGLIWGIYMSLVAARV